MLKELIINVNPEETRVALLENKSLVELFIERDDEENITGNIYKGRVQRVLPGMQAAFVDIGLKQAAFLYVDDIAYKKKENKEEGNIKPREKERIEKLIEEGQEIMVQVIKAPVSSKGARVSTQISLPGHFLVLMPTVKHLGISKKIVCPDERQRIKDILEELSGDKGYIARTAAEGIDISTLVREITILDELWEKIQLRYKKQKVSTCIHRDIAVTFRSLRDLLTQENTPRLIIDSEKGCKAVRDFLSRIMPDLNIEVIHYQGRELIFDAYNIENEIQKALKRKVWLKSGGYLVIEQTEALTSIDVNTGRYVGKKNFEETILTTNLEAVKEIAYQIRLRNLCGIIIIDFIDMSEAENQEKVFQSLKDAMQGDKVKTNILPLSEFGLIQMTRKRTRKPLVKSLCSSCLCCESRGYVLSAESVKLQIYRSLLRYSRDAGGHSFNVYCHPDTAKKLSDKSSLLMKNIERKTGLSVFVFPDASYHPEQFDIIEKI